MLSCNSELHEGHIGRNILPVLTIPQFNMVIHFRPRKLGAKPDALTRQWDVSCKGGNSDFASANPSNFQPIFSQQQLTTSLRATVLATPIRKTTWSFSLHLGIFVFHRRLFSYFTFRDRLLLQLLELHILYLLTFSSFAASA
jgi:hypothetical protein